MPWKNGGGETTEIVVSPAGSSLDTFDWRISMARVEGDGPFSVFGGIDRTLSILEGEGIQLVVGDRKQTLTADSPPFAFAADIPTSATLLGGTIIDLNVMSRRASFRHSVTRRMVAGEVVLAESATVRVLLCDSGSVVIGQGAEAITLDRRDALIHHRESLSLTAAGPSTVFDIAFWSLA
jgi:hypothetical protein